MTVIKISDKEKMIGLKLKIFRGNSLEECYKLKENWLSHQKNIKEVKTKAKTVSGKGKVVGRWTRNTVYLSYINADKFDDLKNYRRNRDAKKTN